MQLVVFIQSTTFYYFNQRAACCCTQFPHYSKKFENIPRYDSLIMSHDRWVICNCVEIVDYAVLQYYAVMLNKKCCFRRKSSVLPPDSRIFEKKMKKRLSRVKSLLRRESRFVRISGFTQVTWLTKTKDEVQNAPQKYANVNIWPDNLRRPES